ncbi:DUF6065 family protein [Streptomyces ochraceiscleroticus]|uniref:DUF6065 family protein n=1 Tax=Streptomyces ochraceiscleroticus TaxID=47761 RepID=A0ABW1MKK3_9ACTN|nr:DUF6065 family protein [Streptomyces ochraceiscleroticus]
MTDPDGLDFIAYELHQNTGYTLVPAPPARSWMRETPASFAHRCLPLVVANQAGWLILNGWTVRCRWDTDAFDGVTVDHPTPAPLHQAVSHFGSGIVTWNLPFLFRTPPGYHLLVRGPANHVKDGAVALEGIVETDRTTSTFTMNWKLTRKDVWTVFEHGEPLCMLVPHRDGELERFRPSVLPIAADPRLAADYERWTRNRADFLRDLSRPGSAAQQAGWQQDYLRGRTAAGRPAAPRTRRRLRRFTRPGTDETEAGEADARHRSDH